MGAQNAKLESQVGNLTQDEMLQLRKTFLEISKSDASEKHHIICSYTNFQSHCENYLDDWLAKKLTDKLSVKSSKGSEFVIPLQNFLLFISAIFKESSDEKFETIWNLLVEEKPARIQERRFQADEILKYTRSIIESYLICTKNSQEAKSWANVVPVSSDSVNDLANYLLQELFHRGVDEKKLIYEDASDRKNLKDANGSTKQFSFDNVTKSLCQNLLFLNIHNSVISECFQFEKSNYVSKNLIPNCLRIQTAFTPTDFSVLDLPRIMFLNAHLPIEYRKKWKHLFSTSQHGESFSKLLGLIQDKGPTVIIIKDTAGRTFGAFAPQNWNMSPKFFGDERSFLFHMQPQYICYSTTGYNKNFQYLNIQQKTMPNGLGFGGTLEYFGIWIDSEFGKGKCSPTCTTFNSPQMTVTQDFTIDHLEVWAVGEEPKKEEGVRDQSILDKDPEAKAILEMLDKGNKSDGYRDVPKDNIDVMAK